LIAILTALIFGALQPAHADALLPVTVQTLGARAESVVRGEVLHQRLEHDQDGIWTIAMVRVTETLQGDPVPVKEVRVPGGRLQDLEIMVARAPRLLPGDEVLLFLKGDRIVGLGEGAFVIHQERVWRALDAWSFGPSYSRGLSAESLSISRVRNALSCADASSARPSSAAR